MKNNINYKTKQKESILTYLSSLNGKHFRISDIINHFDDTNKSISSATIYRYIDFLVNKGIVKKYNIDGSSSACFQYVGEGTYCNEHFHLKCNECGELIHLDCDSIQNLFNHLFENHNFYINMNKTVFYGKCEKCEKREKCEN